MKDRNLTKLDILFIRACKSINPHKRVNSLYEKFYYAGMKYNFNSISHILMEICLKVDSSDYLPKHLTDKMKPSFRQYYVSSELLQLYKDADDLLWYIQLTGVLIGYLRLEVSCDELEKFGYIKPSKWRNK